MEERAFRLRSCLALHMTFAQVQPKVVSNSHALNNDEAECERDKNSFGELIHVRLTSMRLAFSSSSALGPGKKAGLRKRSYRSVEAE
ncbi:MAG: hypothetical protein WKF37_08660 [Bryobacteraceae bacterium]